MSLIHFFMRQFLAMLVWVFILSISFGGQTLFDRIHRIVFENNLYMTISDEVHEQGAFLSEKFRVAYQAVMADSGVEVH